MDVRRLMTREWWTSCRIWALVILFTGLAAMGGIVYLCAVNPPFSAIVGGFLLGLVVAPSGADAGFGIGGGVAGYLAYSMVQHLSMCHVVCP